MKPFLMVWKQLKINIRGVPRSDGAWVKSKFGAPCSNRSFGSKCSLLKKVLATLLGLFGARGIVLSFLPTVYP